MMEKTNILVTGIGGGSVGEQILKALKLSNLQLNIYGCDTTPISKGAPDVDEFFVLPPARDKVYIDVLLNFCIEKKILVVFPGSEPELKVLAAQREKFAANNILLPINPNAVLDICLDKNKTADFLNQHGFTNPRSILVKSQQDLERIDFFPAILKPSTGAGGSANVMVAQTPVEVKAFGTYLLNICSEFIAQEYVGDGDNEFTVGVLCSMQGAIINSISIKRNIKSGLGYKMKVPNQSGKKELGDFLYVSSGISQGEVMAPSFINKACEKLALVLGCTSSVNIQCRVVNNTVYVFEINPRFSGTTSLRALAGYNEPGVLISQEIMGEKITPHFKYKTGHVIRGLSETFFET